MTSSISDFTMIVGGDGGGAGGSPARFLSAVRLVIDWVLPAASIVVWVGRLSLLLVVVGGSGCVGLGSCS